jgi:hypothetical protein
MEFVIMFDVKNLEVLVKRTGGQDFLDRYI